MTNIYFCVPESKTVFQLDHTFDIEAYNYPLPQENIARFPLKDRDQSRLLVYKKGQIAHKTFFELPDLLDKESLLVFNNTKVIAARLFFHKPSGARIEIFLLNPVHPATDIADIMQRQAPVAWSCLIGNKKKWKGGTLRLTMGEITLEAELTDVENNLVRFNWNSDIPFASVIEMLGNTPLPPYIRRAEQEDDKTRYQTVYSKHEGAVAAPTAGLHFSDPVMEKLHSRGIKTAYVTLHVSAGTFKPVDSADFRHHDMHCEQIILDKKTIKSLHDNYGSIIATGTTSLRTMESLYWFGVKIIEEEKPSFFIEKDYPYASHKEVTFRSSLENVLGFMDKNSLSTLKGETEIFMYPGYRCRSAQGLITNFHLPKSTLLLLIASFMGDDWKRVYSEALGNNYRFLSYGDSSLILP